MSATEFEQRAWAIITATIEGDDDAVAELTDGLVYVQLELVAGVLAEVVSRLLVSRLGLEGARATARVATMGYAVQVAAEQADDVGDGE